MTFVGISGVNARQIWSVIAACVLGAAMPVAHSHNVWLEAEPHVSGSYLLRFGGHEGQLETYPAEKLQKVTAYAANGTEADVSVRRGADPWLRVVVASSAALVAVEFDNGFFSRVEGGHMLNKPMTENPGAVSGVHAMKYHKTVLRWGAIATRRLGRAFEVVALDASQPQAGKPMRFRVYRDGRPAEGVRLSIGENGTAAITGAAGEASVTPVQGHNQLLGILRLPAHSDPRTTSLSYEVLYAFEAR